MAWPLTKVHWTQAPVDWVFFAYAGRVLVYSDYDVTGALLSSVEMLSLDKSSNWQIQPTFMFAADAVFSSVTLPD